MTLTHIITMKTKVEKGLASHSSNTIDTTDVNPIESSPPTTNSKSGNLTTKNHMINYKMKNCPLVTHSRM